METLNQDAIYQVMDYFATELNPAQMDQMADVLTGAISNILESMAWVRDMDSPEYKLNSLVGNSQNLLTLSNALVRLDGYKLSCNGEHLRLLLPHFTDGEVEVKEA